MMTGTTCLSDMKPLLAILVCAILFACETSDHAAGVIIGPRVYFIHIP